MSANICGNLMPILRIVAYLFKLLQWIIPVGLILLVTIDFIKSMSSNDDKVMEKAKHDAPKRIIYAVVIFIIPIAIRFIFKTISSNLSSDGLSGATNWIKCFDDALSDV